MTSDSPFARTDPAEDLVEKLLPGHASDPLNDIASTVFVDGPTESVSISPIDQFMTALVRESYSNPLIGGAGVIQLPRSAHDYGILAAICSHLMLARHRPPDIGPLVFVSLDVNLFERLKDVKIRNRRRMGLAEGNPLNIHRLRRDGLLAPPRGSPRKPISNALVYYNPRTGQPDLATAPPVVIIDGTTIGSPAIRSRVVEWAQGCSAASVIMLGDLGDAGMRDVLCELGYIPTVIPITPDIVAALVYTYGTCPPSTSSLSTTQLLSWTPSAVEVRQVDAPAIDKLLCDAYSAFGGRPGDEPPFELDGALKLLRNGTRLAASVQSYRAACVHNLQPGEQPRSLLRRLDRARSELPGNWSTWGSTRWPRLRLSVQKIWEHLEEANPKLSALWSSLDEFTRAEPGAVVVRCHSRAAAEATLYDLAECPDRTESQLQLWSQIADRVTVCRYSDRYPARRFSLQIISGNPPPWQLSILTSVEADRTIVLAYPAEARLLSHAVDRWTNDLHGWRVAAFRTLELDEPTNYEPAVVLTGNSSLITTTDSALTAAKTSLADILAAASRTIDIGERKRPTPRDHCVGTERLCLEVTLSDGRTWWIPSAEDNDTPVLTVDAGGHSYRPASELRPGMSLIVPAGEGTESIHARLVAASRCDADIAALDIILEQFRTAARKVLRSYSTKRSAIAALESAGACHPSQLDAWASGRTIAPQEPGDVEVVFALAEARALDLALVYEVAGTLRQLNRTLGRFVAAIVGGHRADTVDQLRQLVGPTADEIVDEFVTLEITEIGEPMSVSTALAGRALHHKARSTA